MARLTNIDALRNQNLDELIRRVHQDKEDIVIEDQTMPVAALIDINKYQLLTELLDRAEGERSVTHGTQAHQPGEPLVRGSNVTIRELIDYHLRGDGIEELSRRFGQLNRAQIYGALAYYYEHPEEIDALIAARRAERSAAEPGASLRKPPAPEE